MKAIVMWGMLGLGLLGVSAVAQAVPVVISDPYRGSNAGGSGTDASDAIGVYRKFDIESLTLTEITPSQVTVQIRTNYNHGDTTLGTIVVGGRALQVGDLLFSVGGAFEYGVALRSHDGFLEGHLYEIDGARLSNYYMGSYPITHYRENTAVRMDPVGVDFGRHGPGTVTTSGIEHAEILIEVSFVPIGDFFRDYLEHGLGAHFAVATCANDFVSGETGIPPAQVPGPASALLLLSGTGALGAVASIRRRR